MKFKLELLGLIWIGLLCTSAYIFTNSWWASVMWLLWLIRVIHLRKSYGVILLLVALLAGGCTVNDWCQRQYAPQLQVGEYEVLLEMNPLTIKVDETWRGEAKVIIGNERVPIIFTMENELMADDMWVANHFGVVLQARIQLNQPDSARNFGVFDYQKYLSNRRIDYIGRVMKVEQVLLQPNWWDKIKQSLMGSLLLLRDTWWGALVAKLVWNANSMLFYQVADELSVLGLLHLFAISGFHFMWLRRILLRYMLLPIGFRRELAEDIVLMIWIVYGALLNWSIGAVRVVATMVVKRFGRSLQPVECLSLVGIIALLIEPRLSLQIGYVLSFGMSFLYQILPRQSSKWYVYGSTVMTSFPLVVSVQHFFGWTYVIGGALLAPLVERVVLPVAVLTALLAGIMFEQAHALCVLLSPLLQKSMDWVNGYVYPWIIGALNPVWFLCWLFLWCIWLKWGDVYKARVLSVGVVIFLLVSMLLPYMHFTHDIYIVDVGQGDCLLYQPAWTDETWLIDTGGRAKWHTQLPDEDYAKRTVIPALKALGIKKLTGVIITHSDLDHIGNLAVLSQIFPMECLYISEETVAHKIWQTLLAQKLRAKKVCVLTAGQKVSLRENIHCYLNPISKGETIDPNDTSIATVIEMGELKVLNLGDLSSPYEEALLKNFPEIEADILKLAHHGSRFSTSERLLQQLQPDIALISSGVHNHYGHPSEEVIQRLNQQMIPYYNTQEQGAIHLQSVAGLHYTIDTMLGK